MDRLDLRPLAALFAVLSGRMLGAAASRHVGITRGKQLVVLVGQKKRWRWPSRTTWAAGVTPSSLSGWGSTQVLIEPPPGRTHHRQVGGTGADQQQREQRCHAATASGFHAPVAAVSLA